MKTIFAHVASGMAVFLVGTGLILAQSPTMPGSQTSEAANASQLSTYVPTEIASSPLRTPDGQRSRERQSWAHRTAARAITPAVGLLTVPRLCFQPGVGWTTIIDPSVTQNEGMEERSSDIGKPGGNPSAQFKHGVPSTGKSPNVTECPPITVGQAGVSAVESNNPFSYSEHQSVNPRLNSITTDGSLQSFLRANRASGLGGNADTQPPFGIHQGFESEGIADPTHPNDALAALKTLQHRAYISPIQVRRLSRNVQDIEMRLELRQMNTRLGKRKEAKTEEEVQKRDLVAWRNVTRHKQLASQDRVKRIERPGIQAPQHR